jgi:hypothetical protein
VQCITSSLLHVIQKELQCVRSTTQFTKYKRNRITKQFTEYKSICITKHTVLHLMQPTKSNTNRQHLSTAQPALCAATTTSYTDATTFFSATIVALPASSAATVVKNIHNILACIFNASTVMPIFIGHSAL